MNYKTIPDMFLNVTNQFSSKPLYHYKKNGEWVGIKGSDVRSTVRNLSAALQSIDVKGGDKVAILSTNSPRWSMTDYAIICNGSVTVTVYPTLLSAQIEYILNNSDTKVLFVENSEQLDKIFEIRENLNSVTHIIVMDDSLKDKSDNIINFINFLDMGQKFENDNSFSLSKISEEIHQDDLLTIIYTSGTTGNPKGVMLTHGNLISNVTATIKMANLSENEEHTFLSFLPLIKVVLRLYVFEKSILPSSFFGKFCKSRLVT